MNEGSHFAKGLDDVSIEQIRREFRERGGDRGLPGRSMGEHVERLGDRQDPGRERNFVAHEAVRIPASVPSFVVGPNGIRALDEEVDLPEPGLPTYRMGGQRRAVWHGRGEKVVWPFQFADVVEGRRVSKAQERLVVESQGIARRDRVDGDALGVDGFPFRPAAKFRHETAKDLVSRMHHFPFIKIVGIAELHACILSFATPPAAFQYDRGDGSASFIFPATEKE